MRNTIASFFVAETTQISFSVLKIAVLIDILSPYCSEPDVAVSYVVADPDDQFHDEALFTSAGFVLSAPVRIEQVASTAEQTIKVAVVGDQLDEEILEFVVGGEKGIEARPIELDRVVAIIAGLVVDVQGHLANKACFKQRVAEERVVSTRIPEMVLCPAMLQTQREASLGHPQRVE